MAFKNGIQTFTEEELAELARFDAEIDAEELPLTMEERKAERMEARFIEHLLFPEKAKEAVRHSEYYRRTIEARKAYEAAHRAEAKARKARWYAKNKEVLAERRKAERARKKDEAERIKAETETGVLVPV